MPPSASMSQPTSSMAVVVLGMHRSGTSVLSRALIALGVDFGGTYVDAQDDNPKGFFEDKDVNALNVSFLAEMGHRWYTLQLVIDESLANDFKFRDRASALIRSKFSGRKLWGLKEPRITRLVPWWRDAIEDVGVAPRFVLANRNPLSVADSLAKRDGIPRAHALALWALHQIDGLKTLIKDGGIIVDYDLMMDQPSKELQRLARFIDRDIDSNKQDAFVHDFLQRDLRHACHSMETDAGSPLANVCMSFHSRITALAHSGERLEDADLAAIKDALSEAEESLAPYYEWFQAIDAICQDMERAKQDARESNARAQRLRSQLNWFEQKKSVRFWSDIKQVLARREK